MIDRARSAHRVVVIGGGLTGLTAAHRLMCAGVRVTLLEARERIGGAIWTDRRDGFVIEGGADSFLTSKPWGLALCRELGLEPELIAPSEHHRRSFVAREGRLLPVPEGFVLMAPGRLGPFLASPVLSWRGKLRAMLDLVLPRKREDTDESLGSFVRRRLGREALERLVQPLVGGIYTGNPAELSLRATLPQYHEMEQRDGGLIRGGLRQSRAAREGVSRDSGARYGLFASLESGMARLPEALAQRIGEGVIRTSAAVRRLVASEGPGPWRVELLSGESLEAESAIVATEAHAAARLVDGFDPGMALTLRSIPYASTSIVQLAYRRDQVRHPLDGFGAVVPAVEGRSSLAISFTSVKFPSRVPAGTVLIRVFLGGALRPELAERDDSRTLELAIGDVEDLLGVRGNPILAEVARHQRAMPQYTLGHLERVARLEKQRSQHAGLMMAGNYLSGVGVPDCIRSGESAAEQVLARLAGSGKSVAA